jgi:recombination endonuclease VII
VKEFRTSEAKRRSMAKQRAKPGYKERQATYFQKYRADNKKSILAKQAEYARVNAVEIRLKRKGLDPGLKSVVEATNSCGICGRPGDGRWKQLTIDHCHKTGRFRGMLCSRCNRGLGFFQDDPALLKKAMAYLASRRGG